MELYRSKGWKSGPLSAFINCCAHTSHPYVPMGLIMASYNLINIFGLLTSAGFIDEHKLNHAFQAFCIVDQLPS